MNCRKLTYIVFLCFILSACNKVDLPQNLSQYSSGADITKDISKSSSVDSSIYFEESTHSPVEEDVFYPLEITLEPIDREKPSFYSEALNDDEILKIVNILESNYILTKDGRVYSWGTNSVGNVGLGTELNEKTNIPTQVYFKEPIVDIYANPSSGGLFVLGKSGDVYGWGYDHFGIIGKPGAPHINKPVKIEANFKITKLSYSPTMVFVMDDKHNWYMKGKKLEVLNSSLIGNDGVLQSQLHTQWTPLSIPTDYPIVKSIANYDYVAFLDENGKVYFGGDFERTLASPEIIHLPYPEKIVDISAMQRGILSLGESGKVYFVGNDVYSMVSDKKIYAHQEYTTPVALEKIESPVKKISTTSSTIFILTTDNKLYIWGYMLNLSFLNEKDEFTFDPNLIEFSKLVKEIYCGSYSSIIQTIDNEYYGFGTGYQLLFGNDETFHTMTPQKMEYIVYTLK